MCPDFHVQKRMFQVQLHFTIKVLVVIDARDVARAADLLHDVVAPTPLEYSRWLSDLVGGDVFLKCENLQRTGSFKLRGAYVRMARLSTAERARGVVAASAGNHAQGVALAAQLLGIKATVFMPNGAPIPKEKATRAYGAEIRFVGTSIDDCLTAARAFEAETGAVLIHPFDHPDIVAARPRPGWRSSSNARRSGPSSYRPEAAACSPGSRPRCSATDCRSRWSACRRPAPRRTRPR
ncbi:hypothetical protein GCM10009742_36910 [Kribbella karoonensis]|uniref:Tryptophan synthase beta chain-like PALP domain-containing protein n=1 Tax=Kribbella karoonensis TaxID=324851 RepID=A0ABN2DUV5_9ACTN